jgi:hypothetical protein
MQYDITNRLNQVQIDLLRTLKGKSLSDILIDKVGDFALAVVLDSENLHVIIKNIPSVQLDGDEYPCLVVEETDAIKYIKRINIAKEIESITIIRDKATWHYNNDKWVIDSDIAIKFSFNGYKLLFIAHDSLAGFIRIINVKEPLINECKVLDKYWSMKADILDYIERIEIDI